MDVLSRPLPECQKRIQLLGMGIAGALLGLGLRLCWVSIGTHPMTSWVKSPWVVRAPITDRHGHVLASSLVTYSVYAHPSKITQKKEAIQALYQLFPGVGRGALEKMLTSSKTFVWIARHVSPEKRMAVRALGIEGIEVKTDSKRVYPHGRLFCHILGITDVDQQGISGLEKSFQSTLSQDSRPLRTSLDLRLQHIIHQALKNQMQEFQAKAGNAMLADIETGEILAMVSLPDFVPDAPHGVAQKNAQFNRNVSGVFEFGSIMKIHNTALFLESRKGTLASLLDASRPIAIGRFRITDFMGKNRPLTVYEAFIYSSNIAHAKMAAMVGASAQKAFFQKMGFMDPLRLELPECARPLIPSGLWPQARVMTAGYGYGFAITPLHVLSSVRTLISGYYTPLTLLMHTYSKPSKPVLDQAISKSLISLLGQAVVQGQAKNAAALTCEIGAKTGTSNLRTAGRYCAKENLTSCIAIFPLKKPKYILLVSLERPKPNAKTHYFATAGWIAAPLIAKVVDRITPLLGLLSYPPKEDSTALVQHLVETLTKGLP